MFFSVRASSEKLCKLVDFPMHLATISVPFYRDFQYFFGIDFRVAFLSTFFDFWCHYRRPRGPTGGLRGTISAPKGLQKGTTPNSGEPLGTIQVTIFHSKRSVDRFVGFLVVYLFILASFFRCWLECLFILAPCSFNFGFIFQHVFGIDFRVAFSPTFRDIL